MEEHRPLKRSKLGIPDVYPQEIRQREDELTAHTVTHGLRLASAHSYETGSARLDIQHMRSNDFISRLNQIVDAKKRTAWGQDSQKKRMNLSRDSFWPVPVGRSKKEQAAHWFQGLAGSETLEQLVKKRVPIFNKREEIFDVLFEKDVPVPRAVWYIKMTAAHSSLGAEMKLTKKKQAADPSFEWTVSLTKFMQETVWRISNDSSHRNDSVSSSRQTGHSQVLNEDTVIELSRWKYIMELSSWLYQENLLDRHEFLRWLIERIETSKPDEKSLVLYLPLALKYLADICRCVYLARPLVQFCCQKFASSYDLNQKSISIKQSKEVETMETNEDDDVFSATPSIKVKQEPKTSKGHADHSEETTGRHVAGRKRSKSNSLTVTIEDSAISNATAAVTAAAVAATANEKGCKHHSSLLLQLSCIIQVIAIQCPTAFINVSLTGKGIRDNVSKATTPLDKLPLRLSEMPSPKKVTGIEKKLESVLAATEHEIRQRTRAAETGWSTMAIADLQTSNKSNTVLQVLKVLKELDRHSFTTSKSHSTLSTLYVKIAQIQKTTEFREPLCMVLCQWAVSPHRHGLHRPLVAARLLKRLQVDLLGQTTTDLNALDEFWEHPETVAGVSNAGGGGGGGGDLMSYPFQQTLFKFLDTHAPLPESLYFPLKDGEPFKLLITLFAELIDLRVFSYTLYLSTLIARGETTSPIIPALPFFRGEGGNPPLSPMESEPEEFSLATSIPLASLPNYSGGGGMKFDSHKKPLLGIKQEERTISPCLPSAFGSQDNLLATLGDYGSSSFGHDIKMEENPSLLQMRADKLERLAMYEEEEGPSQLVSPIEFGSHASSPIKPDVFNFSLNFLNGSPNQSLDETLGATAAATVTTSLQNPVSLKLDTKAKKLLIYAAYFPVNPAEMSPQSLSQRSVVLCGTGHSRAKVDEIIQKLQAQVSRLLKELSGQESPVLSASVTEFMRDFKLLPSFEQNYIACSGVTYILSLTSGSKRLFPSCSQFVFVSALLETSGSYNQLIQLIVELLTYEEERQQMVYIPLPSTLCLPIVNLLWFYYPIVLLSLHDTLVIYERLFRLVEGLHKPSKFSTAQKSVFLFLKHIQTHCYYIERIYPTLACYFDDYCVPRLEDMTVQSGGFLTTFLKACQDNSVFTGGKQMDSDHAINQVISIICTTNKNSFFFVCEVFHLALQKHTSLQTLTVLAHISAEISCSIDLLPKELLGTIRALCIPNTVYKACVTGYSQLTQKMNVLTSPDIHGNFVMFLGLLLAFNCFTIHDIITYIVKPIFKVYLLYPQESANAQKGSLSLEFVCLVLRHLLVDKYIQGEHCDKEDSCAIVYPPFVSHFLLAKSQELSFDVVLNLLKDLLKLCKDTLRSSKGTTLGGKTGMSIVVESYPSGSQGNEAALVKLRETMELIAQQDWVREKCSKQDSRQLLDSNKLGDASLSPPQAQYLLHLLIPYCPYDTVKGVSEADGSLPSFMIHPDQTIDRILKNLDQWTLHNAVLHLDVNINQGIQLHTTAQVDHLSQSIIQVFEDSCTNEWAGDASSQVDGAHSPSIWLVTPLVSELPKVVLGRILKSAGNVLGKGQWWNPDRLHERRRSARTTSTATTPTAKTGLQWQQPFLELVLACMNSHHSNHEELLQPLQKQLTTFLTAFEKDGFPTDEHNKSMLYTALRLRLGLLGSMLPSVCAVSETYILDWVSLLIQLICSGAVDRQPDNSELFTNCLDMLSALLQALSPDFHMCVVSGGEEGKKSYIQCIKKMKADLACSKSCCKQEIQQLFPLPQKAYEVTVVKPPSSLSQQFRPPDKVQGLRIQETKEISPWEIIEGIKNSGPFQLSWFGATRMKRKPHKYLEQFKMIRHHTHQKNNLGTTGSIRYLVCLPELTTGDPSLQQTEPNPFIGDGTTESTAVPQAASNITANKEILKAIEVLNKVSNAPTQPRPPPPFMTNPTIGPAVIPPPQQPPRPVAGAQSHVMPIQPQQMRPVQMQMRQYEMFMRDLTPEQRNHFLSLPPEERRSYILNIRRNMEQRRAAMIEHHQQQQAMLGGFRGHPIHPRPLQVTPPVQMTQVLQQQRMMPHYGPHGGAGQMGPPPGVHHPVGQPYIMQHGHHPQMFRQMPHMYQGMPPRPPMHY